MVALDQSAGDASVGLTHDECMKAITDERSQGGGITVTTTTTSENGGYIAEIPSSFNMDDITISVSGGVNAYTNEPSEFTAEVKPKHFGTNVTPVTKMASELVKQGEDPENAKEKVVDFVKSLLDSNEIDGKEITHDHLFERTMNEMLISEDKKELAIKATAFQAIETSLKMFADARSGAKLRATNAEDRETSLTDVVKVLRVLEVNEGERIDIDELTDKSLKKMVENDETLVGTSIDTENSFEKLTHSLVENKETLLRSVREHSSLNLSAMEIIQKVEENRKDADIEVEMMKEVFKVDVESCAGNKECADEKVEESFAQKMDAKEEHKNLVEMKKDEGTYVSPITFDVSKLESAKQTQIKQNQLDDVKSSFDSTLRMFKNAESEIESMSLLELLEVKFSSPMVESAVQACLPERPDMIDIDQKICIVNARKSEETFMEYLQDKDWNETADVFRHEEDIANEFNDNESSTDELIETIKTEIEEEGLKFDTRSFDVVDRLRSQITGSRFCCIVAPKGRCCNTLGGNFIVGPKDPGFIDGPIQGDLPFEKIPTLSNLLNDGEELKEAQDFISNKEEKSFPFEGVFEKTGEKKSDLEYWKGWYKNELKTDAYTKEEIDMLLEYFDKKQVGEKPIDGKDPVKEEPVKVTYKTGDGMIKFKKWMDYIFEKYALPQEFSLPTNESEFDARFNEMKAATEQLFEEAKLVDAELWEMQLAQNYSRSWFITNRFGGEEPNENSEYRLLDLYQDMFRRVFETIGLMNPLVNKDTLPNLQLKLNRINFYINQYGTFDTELANAKTEFLGNNDQVWRMNNALSYFIRKIYGEYYKPLINSEIQKVNNWQNSGETVLLVNVDDFRNIEITNEGIEFEATPISVSTPIKSSLEGEYYYILEDGKYEEIGTNKYRVSILKGHYYSNQRDAFLPGLVFGTQEGDWSHRVLYVGLDDCNSYKMMVSFIGSISNHSFNQPTILYNNVDLTISNFRDVEYNSWNNYFYQIWREGDSSLDTSEDIRNSSYWQSNENNVQYAKVYDHFNTLSILNVGDVRVNPCDGYVKLESTNSNLGYYKTIDVVGPYDVDYKDCLYGKFNMETQSNEVFELVDGEYVKHSGKVYASPHDKPITLADKIRNNRQAEYYESIDGVLLRYNTSMNYGLGNSGRGFKTCEGLEKQETYQIHGGHIANNYTLSPWWEGKTVVLKEKDGTIIYEQTVGSNLQQTSSTAFLNSGRFSNQTYLVSVTTDDKTVTMTFENDSTFNDWTNYYSTDSKGKIDYQASTQCVDADGDEIPATVDLDDNDPSIGGDTDRDGIADHEDVFPFDAGTAYTLVRDIETNEQKVVNANLVKFAGTADYMFYIEYPSEGKGEKEKEERSMPIIFGFEIISSSTEDYDVSLSRFNLETGKRFNLDFSDRQSEILERVQEVRNKYSEKGGKK